MKALFFLYKGSPPPQIPQPFSELSSHWLGIANKWGPHVSWGTVLVGSKQFTSGVASLWLVVEMATTEISVGD